MTIFSPTRAARGVDDHVGARIRLRRTSLGMTQEHLGAALAISYQQIQKYETGANRISAGRLFEIAQRMGVDIGYFFEGLETDGLADRLPHGGRNRATIDLVRNFMAIPDKELRAALASLVRLLKDMPPETDNRPAPVYAEADVA